MESKMVEGVVQYKSDKFNGSIKVNDTFYSFGKGIKHDHIHKGDNVSFILKSWESNGKSGYNIVGIDVLEGTKKQVKETGTVENKPPVATDWASKDRAQLVGGRSHDAVELVKVCLQTGEKKEVVLKLYEEMLVAVLEMVERIK